MDSSKYLELPAPAPKPCWSVKGKGALAGLLVVLVVSVIYVLLKLSEPSLWHQASVPGINYQALVNEETSKARMQSQKMVAAFQVSLANLDTKYAARFSLAAYEAAASAAKYQSIILLINHLAWDKVNGTHEAESYLTSQIEPSIIPMVSEFSLNLNSETAKLDNDLQKVTVQLAANIAAIGPGDSRPPPRGDSQENTLPKFQQLLKQLGTTATGNSLLMVNSMIDLLGPRMLPALVSPIRASALRMFGKQIAKLAVLPFVATATGPIPIGPILAVAGGLYTGYQIHRMRADFEDDVYVGLKTRLDEIRTTSKANALQFASTKAKEIEKIQSMIGVKALNNLAKTKPK